MVFLKKIKRLRRYWLEGILLITALLVTFISLFLFIKASEAQTKKDKNPQVIDTIKDDKPLKIYVDVSGAVKNKGLYEALNGQRIKDIIEKAGGLTEEADKDFFARNFNVAEEIFDGQKIYIPSVWEVNNGYFVEEPQKLSLDNPPDNLKQRGEYIDINKATLEELDTIPGVGKVTAQKIIDNRPYGALQELIDKKVMSEKMLENIGDLIGI